MESLTAISSYEHCSASLGNVQKSYAKTLAARDVSHAALRDTWRESMNLIGELAAVIVDGDMFKTFIEGEGCESTLAKQTLKQDRIGIQIGASLFFPLGCLLCMLYFSYSMLKKLKTFELRDSLVRFVLR